MLHHVKTLHNKQGGYIHILSDDKSIYKVYTIEGKIDYILTEYKTGPFARIEQIVESSKFTPFEKIVSRIEGKLSYQDNKLSFSQWLAAIDKICLQELKTSLYNLPYNIDLSILRKFYNEEIDVNAAYNLLVESI